MLQRSLSSGQHFLPFCKCKFCYNLIFVSLHLLHHSDQRETRQGNVKIINKIIGPSSFSCNSQEIMIMNKGDNYHITTVPFQVLVLVPIPVLVPVPGA